MKPDTSRNRGFDRAYFHKYYRDPATRAVEREDLDRLIDHVLSYVRYLGVDVRRVLDVGCGLGMWQKPLKKRCPGVEYVGIDTSPYLCEKYGWVQASMAEFRSRSKFDLIICRSLLQYLDSREVRSGLKNLERLCRGGLYLEIVTLEDWTNNCDQKATDGHIHRRSAQWYRRAVGHHFTNCGGGVFVPRKSEIVLYELEKI